MKKFFIFLVISLLSASLVSASWFSDLFGGMTGNVVDNTAFTDTSKCADSDGGVFANTAGVVIYYGWTAKTYPDKCGGKVFIRYDSDGKPIRAYPSIKEYYCENGVKNQVMNSSTGLSEGYCVSEKVEVEGKSFVSAKWVLAQGVCKVVADGVQDETGKIFRNACFGNIFRTYTCNGTVVQYSDENCTTSDGFGKCSVGGCTGRCTETDSENNKDVHGVVTFNGIKYKDTCHSTNKYVMQYKCVSGRRLTVPYGKSGWQPCGTNRECVVDSVTGAGYCKDKYAGVATLESLQEQVTDLQDQIDGLTVRIEALENPAVLTGRGGGETTGEIEITPIE